VAGVDLSGDHDLAIDQIVEMLATELGLDQIVEMLATELGLDRIG